MPIQKQENRRKADRAKDSSGYPTAAIRQQKLLSRNNSKLHTDRPSHTNGEE
jgi:hypothetical protein